MLVTFVAVSKTATTTLTFAIDAQAEGKISTPKYPNDYPVDSEFVYTVTPAVSWHKYRIELNVVGIGGSLSTAQIAIYDNPAMTQTLLAPYCCGPLQTVVLGTGDFTVKFIADPTISGAGFEIRYKYYSVISSIQYQSSGNQGNFNMRPSPFVFVNTNEARLTDGTDAFQSGHMASKTVKTRLFSILNFHSS